MVAQYISSHRTTHSVRLPLMVVYHMVAQHTSSHRTTHSVRLPLMEVLHVPACYAMSVPLM